MTAFKAIFRSESLAVRPFLISPWSGRGLGFCPVVRPPRLWFAMMLWHQRSRTRRHLRQLDARTLADVGITPARRAAECRKWFWQP